MKCDGIREASHEYLRGGLEPATAGDFERHLSACPECSAETRSTQSALALLNALPDIDPSPDTWKKIEARLPIPVTVRRPAVFRFWLRAAAAASIVVAVSSFAVLMNMPRTGALPVVAETCKALNWNQPFTAPDFTTLTLPDVGTLKLNKDATVRFTDPRTCVLESGDLFADILPSGRGFRVLSRETTVRVHGTRFGVTYPATVVVVEGRVEVASPRGRLTLEPRQAAVDLVQVGAADHLQWLARYERPELRLKLDPRDRTTITPGAPLKWNLILETDALAPLYLVSGRDLSQLLSLRINDATVPLDPNQTAVRDARSGPNGLLRLDVSSPCVLEVGVDPALFRDRGPARVKAVFVSGSDAPAPAWRGFAESAPVTVEVK